MGDTDNRKREADDGEDGDAKRFRSDGDRDEERAHFRFLIPHTTAGPLIGRSGANIKELRENHNAKVSIPDAPGPERLLIVEAALKKCFNCITNILSLMKESNNDSSQLELRYLVHQSQAGCVIGRAGFKIKELREKSSCGIKVFSSCAPDSYERVIALTGSEDTIVACLRDIYDLLLTAPPKGPINPYDPINFDDFNAGEYGGWGDMRGGGGRGGMDRMSRGGGGRMRGGFDRDRGDRRDRGYGGGGGGGRGPPMGRDRGGPFMGGMGGGGGGGRYGGDREEVNTNQVTIPKDLAGAIIGKGGNRIREIRQQSKAVITIDEAPPGANERIINITGTPQDIQKAQYLLQMSVKQYSGQYSGGGRY